MPDLAVARLAARQHGVVAVWQVQMTRLMIQRRVERGWFHRVHRGVYAVGTPRLTREGRFMAAVLAAGPGAAISHDSARTLWRWREGLLSPVHVSLPTTAGRRRRAGIVLHRPSGTLETTEHLGIPVTTPARTLLDIAETLDARGIERALDEAHFREHLHLPTLHELLAAHRHRTGAKRLRRILDRHAPGSTRTRSDYEERFLAFCRRHGLPEPEMNHPLDGVTVDAYFAEADLVVEIDPWHTHSTPQRFAEDRARDRRHLAAGRRTARVTDDDFTPRTADELRRALRRTRPPAVPPRRPPR